MNFIQLSESINITQISLIENCILNIQMEDDIKGNIDRLKDTLNKVFGSNTKCADISIEKNDGVLFGMRVYPYIESIEKISKLVVDPKIDTAKMTQLITTKFNNNMEYVIEIDEKLLYNKLYDFKPSEITAILLHEIGHIIIDTDFYADLKSYYNEALIKCDNLDLSKATFSEKDIIVGSLFVLSAIEKTRIQNIALNNIKLEKMADKFVVDSGYGDNLLSAIDKFNSIYSKAYKKTKVNDVLKTEAETFAQLNSIFETRREYVISLMDNESRKTKSPFMKRILDRLKPKKHKRFAINESVSYVKPMLMDKEYLSESFIKDWLIKPHKVSQRDIDDLKIEAQRMENFDDKSILVFKIHKRIDQIKKHIDSGNVKDSDIAIGKQYIEQLEKLLKEVMMFDARTKRYGVFIKYPKGYEG